MVGPAEVETASIIKGDRPAPLETAPLSGKDNSALGPHPIEVRRALKAWAANKSPEVRNLAGTVCQLMWMSERYPHSNAVRAVLAANLARLETANAE
jgi:hypothetical protein